MENYYSKIRKLEKELKKRTDAYNMWCARRKMLNDQKQAILWTTGIEGELKLSQVAMDVMSADITRISCQLEYLREEYRKYNEENAKDFYRPMDDVDIMMLIHKDGSIHGITL